jgi:uroporphyrinogen-III synthase
VTRPAHQSAALMERLEAAGFHPLAFPSIAIESAPANESLNRLANRIDEYDIALFVSRNAVDHAFRHIDARRLPRSLQLGVIGKGSAAALQAQGVASALIPSGEFNSEGLLAAPALQDVRGRKVIIFRGQAGRNLLGDTLRQRGATVDYCEVYRRTLPDLDAADYRRITGGVTPDLALFTSSEGLRNTLRLIGPQQAEALRQRPWLLISERMRETALDLGHNADIIIAISASDEGIVEAIKRWRQSTSNITHE